MLDVEVKLLQQLARSHYVNLKSQSFNYHINGVIRLTFLVARRVSNGVGRTLWSQIES